MKKNLLVLAGLFVASSALATNFTNGTEFDLQILGRASVMGRGIWYSVGAEGRESFSSAKPLSNSRRFETGMQDNLIIRVGTLKGKDIVPFPGVPSSLRFNLGLIKKYFASVQEVILKRVNNRFVLSMYGKPKVNGLSGAKSYCQNSGNCSVDRISTNSWLIVTDILQ